MLNKTLTLTFFSNCCLKTSVTEESAESQVPWGMSSRTVSCSRWEAEVEDMGDGDIEMIEDLELPEIVANPNKLCQEFSSELKKKFEVRHTQTYTQHAFRASARLQNTDMLKYVLYFLFFAEPAL